MEIAKANAARTEQVRTGGLLVIGKIRLVGALGVSGAKKHYNDVDAIARSDSGVIDLIKSRPFTITKVEARADQFTIAMGRNSTGATLSVVQAQIHSNVDEVRGGSR